MKQPATASNSNYVSREERKKSCMILHPLPFFFHLFSWLWTPPGFSFFFLPLFGSDLNVIHHLYGATKKSSIVSGS